MKPVSSGGTICYPIADLKNWQTQVCSRCQGLFDLCYFVHQCNYKMPHQWCYQCLCQKGNCRKCSKPYTMILDPLNMVQPKEDSVFVDLSSLEEEYDSMDPSILPASPIPPASRRNLRQDLSNVNPNLNPACSSEFDWGLVTLTYGEMEVDDNFDIHADHGDAAFMMFDEGVEQLECEGCLECDECRQYLISCK